MNDALAETLETQTTFALGGDLTVRRIGYGTMRLTGAPEDRRGTTATIWRTARDMNDRDELIDRLRRAVELGVDLIDTADAYALGGGEELIAEALHPYEGSVTVVTKVGVARPSPTEWVPLGHPAYLRQQAELSLRRLGVERLDLLQLHRVDPAYPLADQVGALKQLQDEGKVRHIGLSEVTVEQIEDASRIAPISSVQNLYNLSNRASEAVVDHTAEHGIAFLPYFPVSLDDAHAGPLAAVADEVGATPSQTALAWLLHRSPTVIPIPGTASATHLAENAAALDVRLTAAQFAKLSELS
ncbi:aldo/keto reductase [Streptomyces sp. AV19]|uniref:aldo/keto reductase n=1 Tax=Streptomyces sp. AV19 TaxID=2793068 RepID=UPI0018FE7B6A|nr:aldo/keto reductase [Streptomyces sp. AV19]MBH1933485.1 aldo/keto reductase [Streptomyces sp. AV19]MDG4532134.1 aldo/keto reductase [Streptomyces sp. AV19]